MRLFYFVISFFIVNLSYSQGLEMQSYKFGDGLRFVGESGQSVRLTGYAQPMAELKQTEGYDEVLVPAQQDSVDKLLEPGAGPI